MEQIKETNPFAIDYDLNSDDRLIKSALEGSKEALEKLIKKHQDYIYNVAHKMVLSPFDAEDITQEVLIKMVTKLSQYKGKSNFRTWLYRITFNHFLKMKKYWLENEIISFTSYGEQLDAIQEKNLTDMEQEEQKDLIEESKLACLSGMLLCLDREQRLMYVLADIFGIDHTLGSSLLGISKDNFRQKLSRTRKELHQFMHNKCGLINKNNPCRCAKKTKGFIKEGWVEPERMKFNTSYVKNIKDIVRVKLDDLNTILESEYTVVFRNQPFQQKEHADKLMHSFINDEKMKALFHIE